MHSLDIRTLSFLVLATSLLLALAMQLVNRLNPNYPAVGAWTLGAGQSTLGFALVCLR